MIVEQPSLPTSYSEPPQYGMPLPSAEEQAAGGGFTPLQLWHMLRAYLWLCAGILVVMAGLAFVVIKLLPKSYEATAALIVNLDTNDPLAGRNQQQTYLSYTFFPTQVELIFNNVVLRPVIDRLKLQADRQFTGGFIGDSKTVNDIVLMKLRSSLRVQPGTNSELLYIAATARDPVQAADIANTVAEEYLRQTSQRTNSPAIERATRYSAQLAELKGKVDLTQQRVAEFREKYGMADLKDGKSSEDDVEGAALADLQTKLLEAQNERRQLEGQQVTPEAVTLRGRLDQLQGELGQALATLGPQHPRVLQLKSEIDATRKSLSGNSAMQLARARELESKYQTAVAAERNRLLERRGLQDQGARLLLEQQLASETYAKALRGLDEVQFASEGNYKNVSLVSRAEPPLKPNKPAKLKLFLAAIAASFALALGGPLAYEVLLNRRIRCRDDLERHFRIVMLAQFGPMNPTPAA